VAKHLGVRDCLKAPVPDYDEGQKIDTQRRLESVPYSARKTYFDYAKECLEAFKKKKSDWNALVAACGGTAKDANWHFYRTRFPPALADGAAASEQPPSIEATAPPPSEFVGSDEDIAVLEAAGDDEIIAITVNEPSSELLDEVAESAVESDDGEIRIDRNTLYRLLRNGDWVVKNLPKYRANKKLNYPDPACGTLLAWADEKLPEFMSKYVMAVGQYVTALENKDAERKQKEVERQEKLREKEEAKVQARRDDNRPIHQHFEKLLA